VPSAEFEATTASNQLELVQLLVEAEADPTSVVDGFAGPFAGPKSSLTTALDILDANHGHKRRTSITQVCFRVRGCYLYLV